MAADPFILGIARSDPNSADQLIHGLKVANVFSLSKVGGTTNTTHHGEMIHTAGIPTRHKVKIASQKTTAGTEAVWPKHGTNESDTLGSQSGSTSTTVILPAGHNAAKGMALMVMTGSGRAGQARLIDNVSSNTITVNAAWASQPQSGDLVHLGILAQYANFAYLKSEFSANAQFIRGVLLWYGMPLDAEGVQAAPVVFADDGVVELRTTNTLDGSNNAVTASQIRTEETSYYHGGTLVRRALGPAMFRFQVLVAPASGSYSLWGDVG